MIGLGGVRTGAGVLLTAVLATAFAAPGTPADASADDAFDGRDTAPVAAPSTEPVVADNQLVVRFRPGTRDRVDRIEDAGAEFERTITAGWVGVRTPDGDRAEVSAALAADPAVLDVELNYMRTATAVVPNDTHWALQSDYLSPLRVEAAWDVTTGAGVTIAVVDTGVDLDHPDLAGRLVPGYDFVNDDATPQDDNGHGTLVAGTAAATGNNGVGVSGVAPAATIMPVKVLDADGGGNDVDISAGITWAADHGADVVNLSLAGPGNSAMLAAAVAYARSVGVVVVAATGNAGVDIPYYPAASPGVVSVGATGDDGSAAWFSNRGAYVDVAAPGLAVVSTALDDTYDDASGTSLAAPIVAGIAALVRAHEPGLTEAAVTARLRNTAKDRGPAGFDPVFGAGTVDAYAAVGGPLPASGAQVPAGFGESNATFAQATPMATTASATITPELDEDWYSFDAVPGSYTITVTPFVTGIPLEPRALNPAIELRSPGNALVATKNAQPVNKPETLVQTVTTAGAYRIRIVNAASSASPGSYSLTVALAPPPASPPAPAPPAPASPPAVTAAPAGYWMVDGGGRVYAFGSVSNFGGRSDGAVDLEPTPSGYGYWLVAGTGEVSAFGDASYFGGANASQLAPFVTVTSMSRTANGGGYWLFTTRGRALPFGNAPFLGDMSNVVLNGPVLDSVSTPSGGGYFMVASDGGVFAFGDALFAGSMGGSRLNGPVQSLVPDRDGRGYWLVARDGGVFAFDAAFRDSMGGARLNRPITGMVRFGDGYLMVGEDGGIFNFSNQPFFGSLGASPPPVPVVSVATTG